MLLVLLLCLPHKLCAKIEVRKDKLVVEAWYDNDLPAEQAKVILYRSKEQVQQGIADERGLCTLSTPPAGDYRLEVDAGGGHRTEITFTIAAETVTEAGENKEDVSQRRWLGLLLGLAIIAACAFAARQWLR